MRLSKFRFEDDLHAITVGFNGNIGQLEKAIGALVVAHYYGWRVVTILHTPATIRSINKILGKSLKERCPDRTELSTAVTGIRIADEIGAFWKVALGNRPDKNICNHDYGQRELPL